MALDLYLRAATVGEVFGGDGSDEDEWPETSMDADGACRARTGDPQLAKAVSDVTGGCWGPRSCMGSRRGATSRHPARRARLTNRLTRLSHKGQRPVPGAGAVAARRGEPTPEEAVG